MISKKIQEAVNEQINRELYSAYLYAAMSGHFEHISLKGFAQWMRIQSEEELLHARKFADYLYNRGARVIFKPIEGPPSEWKTPLAAIQEAYKHECYISESINKLSTLAIKENDHATHALLEWFVTEQVEEEANVDEVVQQLKLVEGASSGLFLIDRELAQRKPAPAPPAA